MNLPYSLHYYHSYETNNSYLSSYSCTLKDGGLMIAQAVKNKVELIFNNDKQQRVVLLSISNDNSKTCIGVVGFTIDDKEVLIMLVTSKVPVSYGKNCQLELISIPSNSYITENDVLSSRTKTTLSFIPTCMKALDVKNAKDIGRFIFLGNMNGSTSVYQLEVDQEKMVRIAFSHFFTDFFPRAQSYLLSMDFLEIDEKRRLWAFGFANGLVCVYSIAHCRFDNKSNLKTKVIEYDPIDDSTIKVDSDTQKLVIASHLSSPIHCVKLMKTEKLQNNEPFTIDFIASCYDEKLVCFKNIVNEFMQKPSYFCDISTFSCINSLFAQDAYLILGDLANCVRVLKRNGEEYTAESVIGVNDCVLYVALHGKELVITTRQGNYIFELSMYFVC